MRAIDAQGEVLGFTVAEARAGGAGHKLFHMWQIFVVRARASDARRRAMARVQNGG